MGEEVAEYQGAYKVSAGLLQRFGPRRIIDTPISENGFAGLGIGAAMVGLRPIIEFMTFSFSLVAFDQVVNNAPNMFLMSGGQFNIPITFRGPNGPAHQLGATHSHATEPLYANAPGLKICTPATPRDAKGLLKTAVRDNNPVLVLEAELLYSSKGMVEPPDEELLIPLGKADVKREGGDVSIICYAQTVPLALKVAAQLEEEDISAEIVDLRSIKPLDEKAIFDSVTKTHRAVIVEQDHPFCGVGAEVCYRIQKNIFDALDAPIMRVSQEDGTLSEIYVEDGGKVNVGEKIAFIGGEGEEAPKEEKEKKPEAKEEEKEKPKEEETQKEEKPKAEKEKEEEKAKKEPEIEK